MLSVSEWDHLFNQLSTLQYCIYHTGDIFKECKFWTTSTSNSWCRADLQLNNWRSPKYSFSACFICIVKSFQKINCVTILLATKIFLHFSMIGTNSKCKEVEYSNYDFKTGFRWNVWNLPPKRLYRNTVFLQ